LSVPSLFKACFSRWSHFWIVTHTGTTLYSRKSPFLGEGTN